jgi:hypothetical protein
MIFHSLLDDESKASEQSGEILHYDFLFGYDLSAAIYIRRNSHTVHKSQGVLELSMSKPNTILSISDIWSFLDSDMLSAEKLLMHLAQISENLQDKGRSLYTSLQALAAAAQVYDNIPGAIVDIGVIKSQYHLGTG